MYESDVLDEHKFTFWNVWRDGYTFGWDACWAAVIDGLGGGDAARDIDRALGTK